MSSQMEPQTSQTDAMKAYSSYPFDSDEMYQQGLASILEGSTHDPSSSPAVQEEIKRRTRVFYFNKITGNSITAEEAREYELSIQQSPDEQSKSGDENRVLTFAELKELIETGNVDKIPNNKVIPEGLNEAPPSESTVTARKKPWEITTDS